MTANCEGPVTIFIIDTQVSDTEHISLLPYLQTKMAKGPVRIFCFKFIKCYLFCPVLRRLQVPRCPADRERLDPKMVIVKHWTWWLFTLVRKWIPWGWIPECKVLMSQMSQWFMSHESMSQIWKNNSFGRNNKIKHYFYLICLLPSWLPAQGLFLTWNLDLDLGCLLYSSQALPPSRSEK